MTGTTSIGRAFDDPVRDAQAAFRAILTAMSEPGRVVDLVPDVEAPPGLAPAAAVALLVLADHATPVWLPPGLGDAARYVRFHTGAPSAASVESAQFAVLDGLASEPALAALDPGEDRFPDRSATAIVQCAAVTGGERVTLSGPGIKGMREVAPRGLRPSFWREVAANHARYPLGVDLLLVAGHQIVALPRSSRPGLAAAPGEPR